MKPSIRSLAKEHKIDRATATKICTGITDADEADAAIREWKKTRSEQAPAGIDQETGLTWFQAKMREEVLQKRAERERERQLSGGDLVPIHVIEAAAQSAAASMQRLTFRLYAAGIADSPRLRTEVERLTKEYSEDLHSYVRDYLQRQAEIAKEKAKK